MCMSLLEKRLQVLLDEGRFARLQAESRDTGRTVGAIVRSAIDLHFSTAGASTARAAAARRLLDRADSPHEAEPSWASSKAALEADLDRKLSS